MDSSSNQYDLPNILEIEEAIVNRNSQDVRISMQDLKEIKDKIDQCVSQFDILPSESQNEEYRKKLTDLQRRIGNMVNCPTIVRQSFFAKDEGPEELVECKICYDTFPFNDMESLSCGHLYCTPCLYTYYKNKIIEANVNIKCPDPSCEQTANGADIRKIVDDSLFEKFQRFEIMASLKAEEHCRWCPREGCENAIIADPSSPLHPRLDCNQCGTAFCYDCREKWHPDMTCEQAQETNNPEDEKTKKWKRKHHVKKCPNCGIQIMKNRGCSEMTCSNCKIKFDWKTGETQFQEDETFGDLIFTFPRHMYEAYTSQEFAEIFEKQPDQSKSEHVMVSITAGGMLGLIGLAATLVWLPIFVIAGPPVGVYKVGKFVKKKVSRKDKRKPNEKPKKEFIHFSGDPSPSE